MSLGPKMIHKLADTCTLVGIILFSKHDDIARCMCVHESECELVLMYLLLNLEGFALVFVFE